MSWADIRALARRVVHDTFKLAATYTPPGDNVMPVPVNVRLHTKSLNAGDVRLDRDGYATVIEDVNRIIFDAAEAVPENKGTIVFPPNPALFPNGNTFRIVNVLPPDENGFTPCEVRPS